MTLGLSKLIIDMVSSFTPPSNGGCWGEVEKLKCRPTPTHHVLNLNVGPTPHLYDHEKSIPRVQLN